MIAGRNCNPGIFQRVAYVWSRDCRGNYVLLVDRIARPLRKEQKYGTEAVKGVRCRIEYTKLGRVRVLSFCFSISCVGFLAVCLSKTVSGFFWCGDAVRADVGAAGSVLFLAGCGWSEIFPPFFCSFFLFFMKIFFFQMTERFFSESQWTTSSSSCDNDDRIQRRKGRKKEKRKGGVLVMQRRERENEERSQKL